MTKRFEESANATGTLGIFHNLRHDMPSGLVVFLVALPLCLGIAFASGAPLIAGLIAGISGGLVVAPLSKAPLSVSGPAAGLVTIVIAAIDQFGYDAFLAAVCIAGATQLILGFLRAGIIAYYFPTSVIKGMLAGIGAVLVLKQLPHAFGYDKDYEGDEAFLQADGHNTFTEIPYALGQIHVGATLIALTGIAILILWPRLPFTKKLKLLPAPLAVVVTGVALNGLFGLIAPDLWVSGELLVGIPEFRSVADLGDAFRLPDFTAFANPQIIKTGLVLAVVASLETLLCVEAVDKLDPFKRVTPTSHELKAQGLGNIVSGMVGGLPVTSVIVRSSANVQSGARTKMSAIIHGVLLCGTVAAIPSVLNMIPLAALAAILLHVGYRLASIHVFKAIFKKGKAQWIPFLACFCGILLTDLLVGVLVGLAAGVFFVLRQHVSGPYYLHQISSSEKDGHEHVRIELADNVSFLNKANVSALLHSFGPGTIVDIDARRTLHIDPDVIEIIEDFKESAALNYIEVNVKGLGDDLDKSGTRSAAISSVDNERPKAD